MTGVIHTHTSPRYRMTFKRDGSDRVTVRIFDLNLEQEVQATSLDAANQMTLLCEKSKAENIIEDEIADKRRRDYHHYERIEQTRERDDELER